MANDVYEVIMVNELNLWLELYLLLELWVLWWLGGL